MLARTPILEALPVAPMSIRRMATALVAAALVTLTLHATVGNVPAAGAYCTYYYGRVPQATYDPATHTYAIAVEDTNGGGSGTCDSDNYYDGSVLDPVTDGSCAYTWYEDYNYFAQQGYSCTTSVWAAYGFWDTNSDSSAWSHLGTDYYIEWYLWRNNAF
jgi:hypothetical protein